jgi:serine/threonine-protein kinase
VSKAKFTILETISEGPTTAVYKAVQNVLGRTVLLKVLHRHLLQDQELVERFRREATACAMLRSEHIVQVYNLDDIDGTPAIVMEYIEGESLKEYLTRTDDHSEQFAKHVAGSVLKGLVAAHRQGIIHRDIKPGNILVTSDRMIRITDFGLASILTSPSLTVEGVLVGTPAYMSPEQARGESLDSRTDLFSLGITLIEILSGNQIFHGTSYGECINKILQFEPESIDLTIAETSEEFRDFVKLLMRKDKEERFSSAEQALSILTGTPVERIQQKSRRTHWRAPVVGLAVLVVVVGYYLTVYDPDTGTPSSGALDSGLVVGDSLQTPPPPVETERPTESPTIQQNPVEAPQESKLVKDTASVVFTRADSGYVSVTCNPWAKVYLDDQYIGTTPIAGNIRVPVGSHTIAFNNPQFTPIIRTITVQRNEELPIDADFLKTSGYLLFSIGPWAEIFIDDQYRETTPLSQPLIVSSGNRKIRLRHPSYPDHVLEVGLQPGDTLKVSYDFRGAKSQ